MSLAAAPARKNGIPSRLAIASNSLTTRRKSSVSGFNRPKGRFDVLLIDQVGRFDVAAVSRRQEIGVREYRRNQVREFWVGLEVRKGVEYLHIARRVRAQTEGGDQSANRPMRIDGESRGLEKPGEAFRGKFTAPTGS